MTACAAAPAPAKAAATQPASTTTSTTLPPTYPLTGRPAGLAEARRPALVVKIENAPESRPQAGLEMADVVYEEVVEGGITRFLAVFQSTGAPLVGPVRSVRPTDPDIVWPIGGLFAYSGGTRKFIDLLHRAPVRDVGADADGGAYERRRGHAAPHNLYTSTAKLYQQASPTDAPPSQLFRYLAAGHAFGGVGVLPVVHLDLVLGAPSRAAWDWDAATGLWKRSENGTPHVVEGGAQVAATNVIIQFTPYGDSPGDFDPARNPVPRAGVVGTGEAWVLSGGQLVKGTWAKFAPPSVTTYTDSSGAPIALAPGRTWVELVPVGAPATIR